MAGAPDANGWTIFWSQSSGFSVESFAFARVANIPLKNLALTSK
jgi:hypothetical protein